MNTAIIPIVDIHRAKYNPRVLLTPTDPEYKRLKKAIDKFGMVEHPVWNKRSGNLVGGHQRLSILEARGDTTVEVSVVDLSDRDEKTLNLALNKLGGKWDDQRLAHLLNELNVDDFDLDLTGFSIDDLALFPSDDTNERDDAIPDPPKQPIARPGDLFILGRHRLMCGDSTSATDMTKLSGGENAELVFTSPPYAQQRDYGKAKDLVDDWDKLMNQVFENLPLTATAQLLVNLGMVHREGEWQPYWDAWIEFMQHIGFKRFGWYVWDQGPGLPGDWHGRLAPAHEFIFHFNREAKRANRSVKSKHGGVVSDGGLRNKDGSIGGRTKGPSQIKATKIHDSVIRVVRHKGGLGKVGSHPAIFPVELAKEIFSAYTATGDLVYDPFSGSGSTLIAAESSNRRALAMELEPAYVDLCIARWELLTGKRAKLERDGQ